MGAGATTTEVDVLVVARGGTVTLVPGEFIARATRSPEGAAWDGEKHPPHVCYRDSRNWSDFNDRKLSLTEPLKLELGERIQLTFPLRAFQTQDFELTLPGKPGSDNRVRLQFRHDDNKFLVWGLLPLPRPNLSF